MRESDNFLSLPVLFGEVLADMFPGQSVLGGAPYNVARHLQVLGFSPLLISRIGNDALADALIGEMTQRGLSTNGMQHDPVHPTGRVRVMLENNSHRFDILPEQAYDFIQPEPMRRLLRESPPQLAYFGTLAQRALQSRDAAQAFLRECQCPLFLDVNLRAPWYDQAIVAASLQAAHVVKLNGEELAVVARMFGYAGLDEIAQANALQQHFELEGIVVTCGEKGCWLLDSAQQLHFARPTADGRPVVDTVGAGDAFAAVYMQGWLSGWDVQATLQRACDYASAQCRVRGAAPP